MFDNEYIFYGKHANMVNKLKGKLGDTLPGLFSSNYLLYNIAPYIGYRYKRKGTIDKSTGEIIAGLSVSGPTTRMTLENIQEKVPYLLEISKKISRRLGAEI